jgi:SPP1 gp7 family putative phage head morphogenesis protein
MPNEEEIEVRKIESELLKARRKLQKQEGLDRRKHWGVETRVDEYKEKVLDNIDLSELEETLDSFQDEKTVSESLLNDISQQINFENLFKAELVDELKGIVAEMFNRGSTRVLTTDGDTLKVSFDEPPRRLVNQLEQQEIFLKNLSEDAEERVRQSIKQGAEEGKSIGEMKDDIMNDVENMTEHRAETTARSELVQASNEGTEAAMEEAGIDKVMVDASIDNQTCDHGTFDVTIDGKTYTSCREWDGEIFDRRDSPTIPRESHHNCRCALIAHLD